MRPLPEEALCLLLDAEPPLVGHLTATHNAAIIVVHGLKRAFSSLRIDAAAVLFGAATHDLGKTICPEELTGPGDRHEEVGPALLEANGVPPYLARFARTHGRWDREPVELEDLLVALADNVWRGCRNEKLEAMIVQRISTALEMQPWEVFSILDDLIGTIYS